MAEHIGWKPSLTAALGKIGETLAVRQVALTSNLIYTIPEGTPSGIVHRVVFTQDGTGGHTVTYGATVDGAAAPIRTGAGDVTIVEAYPIGGGLWRAFSDYVTSTPTTPPADSVPPVAGTMTASNVTSTGFRLTAAGWSDEGGLDPLPFSYSLDGGSTSTAWQESEIYNASGLTPATAYQCMHRVRDYAGNITVGSPLNVTTLEAITWAPTFTMGTPGLTSIVATASVLSAQASSYQVSYDGGATQSTIAPSGNAFTLSGSAGQAYTNTRLRAVRGTEVGSWVSVPSYTLQAGVTLTPTYRGISVKKEPTLTSTTWAAVPLGTPSATRTVIVYVERDSADFSTAEDLSTATLTVGGVAATADIAFNPHQTDLAARDRRTAIYRAVVPSGTTGDIVFTTPKVAVQTRMAAWTIDAPLALVAANQSGRISTGSGSVTVATSEGGFIVAAVVNNNATTTWTGLPAPDWNVSEYSGGWVAGNGQATTISALAASGRLLLASYQGA